MYIHKYPQNSSGKIRGHVDRENIIFCAILFEEFCGLDITNII